MWRRATSRPRSFITRRVSAPSNTSAVPATVTVAGTRTPIAGRLTRIVGSRRRKSRRRAGWGTGAPAMEATAAPSISSRTRLTVANCVAV
jgi:hypothetical protein